MDKNRKVVHNKIFTVLPMKFCHQLMFLKQTLYKNMNFWRKYQITNQPKQNYCKWNLVVQNFVCNCSLATRTQYVACQPIALFFKANIFKRNRTNTIINNFQNQLIQKTKYQKVSTEQLCNNQSKSNTYLVFNSYKLIQSNLINQIIIVFNLTRNSFEKQLQKTLVKSKTPLKSSQGISQFIVHHLQKNRNIQKNHTKKFTGVPN
eukprot:TRINITY_DN9824_c0_g2_i1.p1 TRINITY_DN9824_c0_g2~~TRINITY_DN9824_c0_g2_i1.p1  ORF type:complete len:205 (-),score=-4.81 TRINITY_DN9824_c0_g2_i1:416-1030(-)